jgi:hypothetical protein
MEKQLVVPGTTASQLSCPISNLDTLTGKFAVSDYIKARAKLNPSNVDALLTEPTDFNCGTAVWLYEHLRQIARDIGFLLAELTDTICTPTTCSEMNVVVPGVEAQFHYLCAAHVGTSNCSAIDYSTHTLEGVVSLLNNAQAFPSRIDIANKSIPKFRTMLRRLYRILAHSYFHHMDTFMKFESQKFVTLRVHTLALKYSLIPADQLIIPGMR